MNAPAPIHVPPLTRADVRLRVYGKAGVDALDYFRRHKPLPAGVRFALLNARFRKPYVYATLRELALAIHRRRAGATIVPWSVLLPIQAQSDDGQPTLRVVEIRTEGDAAAQRRVGYAYVEGRPDGLQRLVEALRSLQPDGVTRA